MGLFINSYEAITPANALSKTISSTPNLLEEGYYESMPVDYKDYIEPKLSRRMSKVVKMGIACAKKCLSETAMDQPDAIVVGTGLGCVQDTAKFLNQLIENKEQMVTPTSFIQSTHNTVAGQIALMLQCKNHNFTFSQKNISFETALLELLMNMETKQFNQALLLGVDEITSESYALLQRTNCIKSDKNPEGPIPGEGAVVFSVSSKKQSNSICEIKELLFGRDNDTIYSLIDQSKANPLNSGLLLYDSQQTDLSSIDFPAINYKTFVGEYDTASAFAVWMACLFLDMPDKTLMPNLNLPTNLEQILIFNEYKDLNRTLITISKC